jgi:hypothetical protein
VLSARRFEVALDQQELTSILSGAPLLVRVTPVDAGPDDSAFAGVWLAPSFTDFSGSPKIYLQQPIDPIWVAGQVVYRGRASTSSGYLDLAALDAGDASAPTVAPESTRHWKLDWSYGALTAAADPVSQRLRFESHKGTATAVKQAGVAIRVTELGLTRQDPYEVWAVACEPEVAACLAALPAGTVDAESCGSYRQVQYCGGL